MKPSEIFPIDSHDSLSSDNNLTFVEAPALAPPEVTITQEQINQIEADNRAAALQLPLPDEDEDL